MFCRERAAGLDQPGAGAGRRTAAKTPEARRSACGGWSSRRGAGRVDRPGRTGRAAGRPRRRPPGRARASTRGGCRGKRREVWIQGSGYVHRWPGGSPRCRRRRPPPSAARRGCAGPAHGTSAGAARGRVEQAAEGVEVVAGDDHPARRQLVDELAVAVIDQVIQVELARAGRPTGAHGGNPRSDSGAGRRSAPRPGRRTTGQRGQAVVERRGNPGGRDLVGVVPVQVGQDLLAGQVHARPAFFGEVADDGQADRALCFQWGLPIHGSYC